MKILYLLRQLRQWRIGGQSARQNGAEKATACVDTKFSIVTRVRSLGHSSFSLVVRDYFFSSIPLYILSLPVHPLLKVHFRSSYCWLVYLFRWLGSLDFSYALELLISIIPSRSLARAFELLPTLSKSFPYFFSTTFRFICSFYF